MSLRICSEYIQLLGKLYAADRQCDFNNGINLALKVDYLHKAVHQYIILHTGCRTVTGLTAEFTLQYFKCRNWVSALLTTYKRYSRN